MKKEAAALQKIGSDHEESDCRALGAVLDRIGDKWTIMVVGVLSHGPTRFNAIMRTLPGVSHRMLTLTLRGLERDGLVKRTAYATIPPRVEYELTALGHSLITPLTGLASWAKANQSKIEAARKRRAMNE
jgi:DNA-binding HxlR family transcriptional regulator